MTDAHRLRALLARMSVFGGTGFGVGFIPIAPGTFGALLGVPLALMLSQVESDLLRSGLIVAICVVGIPICTAATQALGGGKDPGAIVLDEIASLPITFFLIPLDSWTVVAIGFALHRLFDITKPPPARQLERLPDGLGIMADDWIAGLYSNLALRAVLWGLCGS